MSDVNYVLGLDLGAAQDPTAIAVVRRLGGFGSLLDDSTEIYQVGHLERLALGTSYPTIVQHVKFVLGKLPRGTELVIDYTGVGRPMFEMFEVAGVDPIEVLITGGNTESNDGRVYSVPKINLISWVQALLHSERLKIQASLPEARALVREPQEFRIDFSASGHMTFNARSGQHDDLLLSLAIACWRAKVAVGPPILSFYWSEVELAKQRQSTQDQSLREQSESFSEGRRPSLRRAMAQVRDDANELTELYLNTLAGLRKTNVCASCGRELGVTRINDGVSLWHPDCPVPRILA
jgi:hypothetical protein